LSRESALWCARRRNVIVSAALRKSAPRIVLNQPDEPRDRLGVSLRGKRILVVDDNQDARRVLRLVFEYCGADVFVAESGRGALPLFARVKPHVVVADIAMPLWDGYRLLREIRSLPAGQRPRTPVIAVTAYREVHHETRARRAGFNAWLTKPIDIRRICAVVQRLVRAD